MKEKANVTYVPNTTANIYYNINFESLGCKWDNLNISFPFLIHKKLKEILHQNTFREKEVLMIKKIMETLQEKMGNSKVKSRKSYQKQKKLIFDFQLLKA